MSALWHDSGNGWELLASAAFPAEAALHSLVEEAPQLLPLSGAPRLVVLGREVQLGGNYCDLLAVEPSGRVVVIEVKLSRNADARRGVVAQALTYAAFLKGLDPHVLTRDVLGTHLRERGFESIADAVASEDQERTFDVADFESGLETSLAEGAFRIVLVLDDAPDELVRLVGYLESVSETLTIDLVTVSAYDVGDSRVLVPQRVDPERQPVEQQLQRRPRSPLAAGAFADGADDFESGIERADAKHRPALKKLVGWARQLEADGLARLKTFNGQGRQTLLPWLTSEQVGLVTIWNDNGAFLSLWRSVFERRAPEIIPVVEEAIAPATIGQGNTVHDISDELLAALRRAYEEAVGASRSRARFDWSMAREALERLPSGAWTTYGDIAALVNTAAMPVGQWLAREPGVPNAWRVLGGNGRLRPEFRWLDPNDTRDVMDVLRQEGVRVGADGVADRTQRLDAEALRCLIGADAAGSTR